MKNILNFNERARIMKIIGILLILGGIALGLYVGLYVCAIGGIIQVIEACKVTPVESAGIAIGIVRFCCAGIVGWLSALFPISIGSAMLSN